MASLSDGLITTSSLSERPNSLPIQCEADHRVQRRTSEVGLSVLQKIQNFLAHPVSKGSIIAGCIIVAGIALAVCILMPPTIPFVLPVAAIVIVIGLGLLSVNRVPEEIQMSPVDPDLFPTRSEIWAMTEKKIQDVPLERKELAKRIENLETQRLETVSRITNIREHYRRENNLKEYEHLFEVPESEIAQEIARLNNIEGKIASLRLDLEAYDVRLRNYKTRQYYLPN